MIRSEEPEHLENLKVRIYAPHDQSDVARLYEEGLLAGQIDPNDTGADIENIVEAYFDEPANRFWVAVREREVLGMIGVVRDEDHTAEIRRLRVQKDLQQTDIGHRLIEVAVHHCREHGYLKVVFDTRFEPSSALNLFDRFGFQHARTRSKFDKELLEFYLDLYRPDTRGPRDDD